MATKKLVRDPTTGKLIRNSGGSLRSYDADANPDGPPTNCCCEETPTCCDIDPQNTTEITLTFESGCAAINGATVTLTPHSTLSNCWTTNTIQPIGDGCLTEDFNLCCEDPGGWKLFPFSVQADGCGLTFDPETFTIPLASVSCDPFELVFESSIRAIEGGTCFCCDLGETVIIRATL